MSCRSRECWFLSLTLCFRVDLHVSSGTFWISILCLHTEGASSWAFMYHDDTLLQALGQWSVWGKDLHPLLHPYQSAPAGPRICPWGTSPRALLNALQYCKLPQGFQYIFSFSYVVVYFIFLLQSGTLHIVNVGGLNTTDFYHNREYRRPNL